MSNEEKQLNNEPEKKNTPVAPEKKGIKAVWGKVCGFFGKFTKKKKRGASYAASLNIWEQAALAEKQAEEQAEAARIAAEQADAAAKAAAEAKKLLDDAEKVAVTAIEETATEPNLNKKRDKSETITPEDTVKAAAEAAETARIAAQEMADAASAAAQRLIDAKAVVAQAAIEWENSKKEAALRVAADYNASKLEEKEYANTENVIAVAADATADEGGPNPEQPHDGEAAILYKEMSPTRMVLRRFFRSRLSMVGLIMLIVLFVFAFLGPPIFHAFGYEWGEVTRDTDPVIKTGIIRVETTDANGDPVEIFQIIEQEVTLNTYDTPSAKHLLGTDQFGMDVFIRLMYGGRVSLTLGFVVVILETIIGVILGGLAGYFGGWVDQVIMRIVDILNCIPTLPILLIASAVLQSFQIPGQSNIYFLMIIITIFGWSGIARLVRGQILYLREQEYIVACEVMGIPTWRRIFKHLLPNVMPQLIVSMTLGLGSTILYESTLSYLQLGIPKPYAAWGTMISSANDQTMLVYYPNLWIPAGLLIIIAVLGFNFVGDGLRDAMDPKSKR